MTAITITIEADYDLTPTEVWPDGDWPQQITAEAVAEAMRQGGSKGRVLADWMLLDGLRVTVVVDGETAEVWR